MYCSMCILSCYNLKFDKLRAGSSSLRPGNLHVWGRAGCVLAHVIVLEEAPSQQLPKGFGRWPLSLVHDQLTESLASAISTSKSHSEEDNPLCHSWAHSTLEKSVPARQDCHLWGFKKSNHAGTYSAQWRVYRAHRAWFGPTKATFQHVFFPTNKTTTWIVTGLRSPALDHNLVIHTK